MRFVELFVVALTLNSQRRTMKTFEQFLAEAGNQVILWAQRPSEGVRSVRVADIPANQSTAHEKWFARMGWPGHGAAFDKISRGEATVMGRTVRIVVSGGGGLFHPNKFAAPEVVKHLKDTYKLQGYQFLEGDVRTWRDLDEDNRPVWQRMGSGTHISSGFIMPGGKIKEGGSHHDLAKEMGFRFATDPIYEGGIRFTKRNPGHDWATTREGDVEEEVGFELLNVGTAIDLLIKHLRSQVYRGPTFVDLMKVGKRDELSVVRPGSFKNSGEALRWLMSQREDLLHEAYTKTQPQYWYVDWGFYDPTEEIMHANHDAMNHDLLAKSLGYKGVNDAVDENGLIRWAMLKSGGMVIDFANYKEVKAAAIQMIKDRVIDHPVEVEVSSCKRPHKSIMSKEFASGPEAIRALNGIAITEAFEGKRFKLADALCKFVEKQWPGVDLSLADHNFNDETHLSMIEVPLEQRRSGIGSQIMRMVTDYADQNKRVLTLSPEYRGRGGPSKDKLTAWYREFGFVPNKGRNKDYRFRALMIRRPR